MGALPRVVWDRGGTGGMVALPRVVWDRGGTVGMRALPKVVWDRGGNRRDGCPPKGCLG